MEAGKRSIYREYPPPRALADRVVCLWTQDILGEEGYSHPVLPDGCMDIVWIEGEWPVVAGPATRRIMVALPAHARLLGVRFRPGWAAPSFRTPVDDFLNQDIPLNWIWPRGAAALRDGGVAHRPRSEALRSLGEVLGRLCADTPGIDARLQYSVCWLIDRPTGRVADLAREIGRSERQLRRWFTQAVGYPPKTFQRIMRLQRVLAMPPAWLDRVGSAHAAVEAGFADQAHMCREVLALTGETPAALLRRRSGSTVSDMFNTDEAFPGSLSEDGSPIGHGDGACNRDSA